MLEYSPVKMRRSMKYGSNYWVGFSYKQQRYVHFYSDLEYENWILVETNPEVEAFCEQPLRIQYLLEGKKVESVFDMWIRWKDGKQSFCEIKYSTELDKENKKYERTLKQIQVQEDWCKMNGYSHEVLTELVIRKNQVLLDNKRQIIPYTREFNSYNLQDHEPILAVLKSGKSTVKQLFEKLSFLSNQQIYTSLFYLIYHGKVNANIDCEIIGTFTEVWLND